MSNLRKIVAERLTKSKLTVPHYYMTFKIDMTNLMAFKKDIEEKL